MYLRFLCVSCNCNFTLYSFKHVLLCILQLYTCTLHRVFAYYGAGLRFFNKFIKRFILEILSLCVVEVSSLM